MGKFKDLTGQVFGRLTVVRRAENMGRYVAWECQCSCGNTVIVRGNALSSGVCKSCGCLNMEKRKSRRMNLVGQVFGRLTVLEKVPNKGKHTYWKCRCSCGNLVEVRTNTLRTGQTQSCGCLKREITSQLLSQRNLKHNMCQTRLCRIWYGMKDRCYRPTNSRYKYYGAKGVTVCEEWRTDFLPFYNWSVRHGYQANLTIDRINPYGNYEPSNCRWITIQEQQRNKRKRGT